MPRRGALPGSPPARCRARLRRAHVRARPRPGGTRSQGACPPAPQRDALPGGRCPRPGGARSQVHRLPAVVRARPRPGGTRTQGACPPAPQRDALPGGRCPRPGGARSQVHRLPAVGHGSDVPMSVPARAPEGRAPRGALPAPRRGALRRLPHRPPSAPRGAVQCPPHARWHPGIVMHCPTTPIHGDHGNILHCRTLQRDPVDVT